MFVGREYYLDDLASLWRKATSSLVACRGRRRVGKSRLFKEFALRTADKYVELAGLPPRKGMTNQMQLDAFAAGLARAFGGRRAKFEDWSEAFAALDRGIDDRRRTVFDVLSVTGGIPRYLEEIDPGLSAEEDIRRLCFTSSGTLFKDFNETFAQVFGEGRC